MCVITVTRDTMFLIMHMAFGLLYTKKLFPPLFQQLKKA